MALCSKQVKDFVKTLRQLNPPLSYPEIEEKVFAAGFRDPNGKRISNAALSAETIKDYPFLRVRKPNKSKKKKTTTKSKKNTEHKNIKLRISELKKLGFNSEQIVTILAME